MFIGQVKVKIKDMFIQIPTFHLSYVLYLTSWQRRFVSISRQERSRLIYLESIWSWFLFQHRVLKLRYHK